MAKKGSSKTKKKSIKTAEPVESVELDAASGDLAPVEPRPVDYLRAIAGLAWNWLKSNKLRAALAVAALAVVCTLSVAWLLPDKAPLDNGQIVTLVNKELGISGDGNPAILTVEDETKATQPFLSEAQNGDKVLLYYKAKRAVLYRPSEERVVHQGSYAPPDAKVFIRRGTEDGGKLEELREKLESVKEVEIVSQDNSPKSDYRGIKLISVTDRYDEKIKELEKLLGVQVERIPQGETFPDADILIIVGS